MTTTITVSTNSYQVLRDALVTLKALIAYNQSLNINDHVRENNAQFVDALERETSEAIKLSKAIADFIDLVS